MLRCLATLALYTASSAVVVEVLQCEEDVAAAAAAAAAATQHHIYRARGRSTMLAGKERIVGLQWKVQEEEEG